MILDSRLFSTTWSSKARQSLRISTLTSITSLSSKQRSWTSNCDPSLPRSLLTPSKRFTTTRKRKWTGPSGSRESPPKLSCLQGCKGNCWAASFPKRISWSGDQSGSELESKSKESRQPRTPTWSSNSRMSRRSIAASHVKSTREKLVYLAWVPKRTRQALILSCKLERAREHETTECSQPDVLHK